MAEAMGSTKAFLLRIRQGKIAEYKRRHAQIWPEMVEALEQLGYRHYDIFVHEGSGCVFGHVLIDSTVTGRADHPTILRWRAYMADVLEMDGDLPVQEVLEKVFTLSNDVKAAP